MNPSTSSPQAESLERARSLDTVRGLTILVMIFVNDLASVRGPPAWMKHIQPPNADGMTFVDVVFPAFLFLVGAAIPFAIDARLKRGESLARVWLHVLIRTVGLLIIGVFMVNEESMSDRLIISRPLWTLLLYSGVILVWGTTTGRQKSLLAQVLGAALLGVAAVLYRGQGEPGLIELRPQWWGILGLIGWAYLVGCSVYLLSRKQLAGVVGAIALLYCLYIADAGGAFSGMTWITDWINVGAALGSHGAITVSGIAFALILTRAPGTPAVRLRQALVFILGLAAAAWLLHAAHSVHPMFIINKIAATPPWCLYCSAITAALWLALYWLMELRGWNGGTRNLQAAGQNALLAYILPPILYAAFELVAMAVAWPNYYEQLNHSFIPGFWRAVAMALIATWLAARLRRKGVVLRL
jgi:predicted acyltransferase